MKKNIYLIVIMLLIVFSARSQSWTPVIYDSIGDGNNPSLLDGTELDFYYDSNTDSVWFNIFVDAITSVHEIAFGVNVMVNISHGGSTFNFWGTDNNGAYHKLITVWVTGAPPSNYSGTIGIADATGVNAMNYTNLSSNNISIYMDVPSEAITIGLKREDIFPDSVFGGGNILTFGVAAAVGSNQSWNDDIYALGASATITMTTNITKPTVSEEIIVYTLPTSRLLVVELNELYTINSKIFVTDVSGKIVKEKEIIDSKSVSFSTSEMAKGIYFVTVYRDALKLFEKKVFVE